MYGIPIDLAISNDGRWAALRTVCLPPNSYQPPPEPGWVYAWDLQTTGFPMVFAAPERHDSSGPNNDLIAVLDDRVLSVGGSVQPSTLVDVRGFQLDPPSAILHSNAYGRVSDAAIGYAPGTMEHLGAVRHERGPVTLWNLDTGAPWNLASVAIPWFDFNCAGNWPGWLTGNGGTSDGCSDAIALTGNRVVAIANGNYPMALNGTGATRGMVGVSDLLGASGWPKHFVFTPCSTQPATKEFVHDVAITPDETRAVVSGTGLLGYYNLTKGGALTALMENAVLELPTPFFTLFVNDYWTVDSIEATNTRAVMIGNKGSHNDSTGGLLHSNFPFGVNDLKAFEITVAALRPAGISGHVTFGASAYPNVVSLNVAGPSRAADLAITPNQSLAIVHTRAATIVIDLTADVDPSSLVPTVLQTTADPLDIRTGGGSTITDAIVLSDSVECTDSHAVVIGQRPQPAAPIHNTEGVVEIIDLGAVPAPTINATLVIGNDYAPTDVAITPDGTRAIVRSLHWGLNAGQFNDGRITVVDIANGAVVYDTLAASPVLGKARGIDQVECTNGIAVSAGDDASNGMNPSTTAGWFQIVKFD